MLDFEIELYDKFYRHFSLVYPHVNIKTHPLEVVKALPTISIYVTDNVVDERYITSGNIENISVVTFEVEVYSNDPDEAREMLMTINTFLKNLGLVRKMWSNIKNYNYPEINRRHARYRGRVSDFSGLRNYIIYGG